MKLLYACVATSAHLWVPCVVGCWSSPVSLMSCLCAVCRISGLSGNSARMGEVAANHGHRSPYRWVSRFPHGVLTLCMLILIQVHQHMHTDVQPTQHKLLVTCTHFHAIFSLSKHNCPSGWCWGRVSFFKPSVLNVFLWSGVYYIQWGTLITNSSIANFLIYVTKQWPQPCATIPYGKLFWYNKFLLITNSLTRNFWFVIWVFHCICGIQSVLLMHWPGCVYVYVHACTIRMYVCTYVHMNMLNMCNAVHCAYFKHM